MTWRADGAAVFHTGLRPDALQQAGSGNRLKHDPEKWAPVSEQIIRKQTGQSGMTTRRQSHPAPATTRRTLVTSLPASRMRAIASAIGSIATAMWKALA